METAIQSERNFLIQEINFVRITEEPMNIYLNEIFAISKNEYDKWTLCLNNANAEQVYSFDENETRLLEHISWKNIEVLQPVFGIYTLHTVCNFFAWKKSKNTINGFFGSL